MPNDAISREAAIEAVEKLIRTYESTLDKLTAKESSHQSHTDFVEGASNGALAAKDAIASLPADTRWQELRKYILAIRSGDVPVTHTGGDYVTATCNLILGEFHRLAPAPAEDKDVPKRPPMLLASIGDCSRDVWWTRQGEDLWESQRIFGVATHSSSAGLLVSRDHSDPEALRLYLEDMAEAQG
jgi:hypothetical protein